MAIVAQFIKTLPLSVFFTVLFFVTNTYLSKDVGNYIDFYNEANLRGWADLYEYSKEINVEYIFLITNKIIPFDFYFFLAVYIFTSIHIKLNFISLFAKKTGVNSLYFVFAYIAFLGFVNDGAQLRISMAFAISMLAMSYYIKERMFLFVAFALIAGLFHNSIYVFFLIFLLSKTTIILFNPLPFILLLIGIKLLLTKLIEQLLEIILGDSRYISYLNIEEGGQDSSGLFNYVLIVLATTAILGQYLLSTNHKRISTQSKSFDFVLRFCNNSGYIAVYLAVMLSFSVAISLRYAEIFYMYFIIAVIISCRKQLKKKYGKLAFASIVVLVSTARFYHTYIHQNPLFS